VFMMVAAAAVEAHGVDWSSPRVVLYDNGPVVNSPSTGVGGADESPTQDTSLGMVSHGFAHSVASGYCLADDFEVALCGWQIDAVTFCAYQTGAPTSPSTMTEVRFQIMDDAPNSPGANVVYGDLVTNRLTSSEWMQCYRLYESLSGTNTDRPIMWNRCELPAPVALSAGVYWLVWQTAGSLSSGPWAPPITVTGETSTGNALQYFDGSWNSVTDTGTHTPQGMPFFLEGTLSPVERTTWGAVKALFR